MYTTWPFVLVYNITKSFLDTAIPGEPVAVLAPAVLGLSSKSAERKRTTMNDCKLD